MYLFECIHVYYLNKNYKKLSHKYLYTYVVTFCSILYLELVVLVLIKFSKLNDV